MKENDKLRHGPGMAFEVQLCQANPDHASRQRRPQPLAVVAPVRPRTDFQWTHYGECVVHAGVKEAFESAELSGVRFSPVLTYTTTGDQFGSELFELSATGWGGVAPSESGVRVVEACESCGRRVFSRYTSPAQVFDLEQWDGSDVFVVWPLPRYLITIGRVRDVILKHRFSGVRISPLTQLPQDPLVTTLSPGNIEDWFSRERAVSLNAEIEAQLGDR